VKPAGTLGAPSGLRMGPRSREGAMSFRFRFGFCVVPALALLAAAPGPAAAQGYKGYPYSIMTPEPGSAKRHRGATAIPPRDTRTAHETAESTTPRYRHRALVARGSSGDVQSRPGSRIAVQLGSQHGGAVWAGLSRRLCSARRAASGGRGGVTALARPGLNGSARVHDREDTMASRTGGEDFR